MSDDGLRAITAVLELCISAITLIVVVMILHEVTRRRP